MPNLKDIRKRIGSVKNTQKITRAMKMVAAAKLRRAQEAVTRMRPYAETLSRLTHMLSQGVSRDTPPLLGAPGADNPPKRAHIIVISSDRGLCGAYNTNINRLALRFSLDNRDRFESITFDVIGRKAREFLNARKVPISSGWTDAWSRPASAVVDDLSQDVIRRFCDGDLDEVYILFTQFKSAIAQEPKLVKLLPIDGPKTPDDASASSAAPPPAQDGVDYLYEPSKDQLLGTLLPRYISTQIRRAILESFASEQGSRMSSMDNATKNAGEMISNLTLLYNRARQAFITRELIEIISGAEAL
jgi:F-type H+-transporting ATPase subunit gamma